MEVPSVMVRELAIWFCPEKEYLRLGVSDLGMPHLTLSGLGAGRITLFNLSVRGMGVHLALPREDSSAFLTAKACCAYLKLLDSSADDPYGILSVFTYSHLAHIKLLDDGLSLGASFVRFAVGSRLEKALEFLDARTCGVSALARWCDNLSRGEHPRPERHQQGLDMDHLLEEVEHVLNHAGRDGGSAGADSAFAPGLSGWPDQPPDPAKPGKETS